MTSLRNGNWRIGTTRQDSKLSFRYNESFKIGNSRDEMLETIRAAHHCSLCLDRAWLLCTLWNTDKTKDSFHFSKKLLRRLITWIGTDHRSYTMSLIAKVGRQMSYIYTLSNKRVPLKLIQMLLWDFIFSSQGYTIHILSNSHCHLFPENIFHQYSEERRRWGRWGWWGEHRRSPPRCHTAGP